MSAALLSGWARTAPTRADVVRPRSEDELAAAVRAAGDRGVLARGLGRAYGDAAQNAGGTVLDVTALDAVEELDLAAATVVAQGGAVLGALARRCLAEGLLPPVLPGTGHVTLGGAIACDVHGKNHHADGSFARHVAWLDLVTPDGERRRLEPGDEAFAATSGGMGLTGVVVRAALRLQRVPGGHVRVRTARRSGLDAVLAGLAGDAARHAIAWLDTLGPRPARAVLQWGEHVASPPGRRTARSPRAPLPLPPAGLLAARPAARALNAARLLACRADAEAVVPVAAFAQPLDGVPEWNRLFGRRGLTQYQVLVPFGAEDVLARVVERAGHVAGSALTTLKRLGPAGPGHLSFPAPGWTAAFDLPAARPGLAALLDGLDEDVAAAGGRVYLAKDARLRPDLLAAMYPRLPAWRAVRDRLDPERRLRSDLARRLGL